jgi:SagB-type dehydrogenase family enzyme
MKSAAMLLGLYIALCAVSDASSTETAASAADSVMQLNEMSRAQRHVFLKGYTGEYDLSDQRKGIPPPPIEKPWPKDAELIDLVDPADLTVGDVPLRAMIGQRRSRRAFSEEPLSLEELSFLLWATQGISRIEMGAGMRVSRQLRTVPSGGARHPFETYLLVQRIEGVPPGIYRYLPVEHKLLALEKGDGYRSRINEICYGQTFVGEGAVVFIWAAIPYRTEWRYTFVGQKDIALEAGHICQNLYLAAESIGGGTCAILGYDQPGIDELVGVDGVDEFVIYLAPVGKIPREP